MPIAAGGWEGVPRLAGGVEVNHVDMSNQFA